MPLHHSGHSKAALCNKQAASRVESGQAAGADAYEALALDLAISPARLSAITTKLAVTHSPHD
jgi:hypothetical protein